MWGALCLSAGFSSAPLPGKCTPSPGCAVRQDLTQIAMMLVVRVQPVPLPGAGIWYRCQSRQHRASPHPGERGTLLRGSVGAEQGREVAALCQNQSCGRGAGIRPWSCSFSPLRSPWHHGAHTRAFPSQPPGNSRSEFSPRLVRDKSFKALGEEFETPPKFAENTYRTRGSQAFRVNKQLLSPSVLCRLCASCSLKAAPRLFARRVLGSSS